MITFALKINQIINLKFFKMKKNIFVFALCAIFAFGLTSCGGEEKTGEELLTTSKGWKLTAATTEPAYLLGEDEVPITDLFNDGYVFPCEKDDILYFNTDKSVKLNYGKFICDGQTGKEEVLEGRWELSDDERTLITPLPWSDGKLRTTVLTLEEKTLKLKFPVSFDEDEEVTHYFTVTYTRN